ILEAVQRPEADEFFQAAPVISELKPDQMRVDWAVYPEFNSSTHYQVQLNHALYGSSVKVNYNKLYNLQPGGTYDVSVVTYHEGTVAGVSSYTRVIMAPPTPLEINIYDVASASFKVIWQKVPQTEKYRIYRDPDTLLAEVDGSENKALVTGFAPGEIFSIYLTAVNSTGESYPSEKYLVKLLPPSPQIEVIEDEIGPSWFSIKWEAIKGATGYNVFINESQVAELGPGELNYTATGLATGTAVSVKIQTINESSASDISEPVIIQLLPAAPMLVATDIGSYSCTLQWSVANGATYYKVYQDNEWCIYNVPSSINQVVVSQHVTEGMIATYTIKAGNGTGESAHSSPVVVSFVASSTSRSAALSSNLLPVLLQNKNTRLDSKLHGQAIVTVFFPQNLDETALALEASYLDSLASDSGFGNVKFVGVFTGKVANFKISEKENLVWKKARRNDSRYRLPGSLPLVKFYDSEGWLVKTTRVSMPVLTSEDVIKELPEAFNFDSDFINLYHDEKAVFDKLHKK
ncbi:MAG: fibronectin type III domain-containing protein, partial [Candidatus Rifleibacteriota bacterium]